MTPGVSDAQTLKGGPWVQIRIIRRLVTHLSAQSYGQGPAGEFEQRMGGGHIQRIQIRRRGFDQGRGQRRAHLGGIE